MPEEKKRPEWMPPCPYPESVFPMSVAEYRNIVPDPKVRGALSGALGRQFWHQAMDSVQDAVEDAYLYERDKYTLEVMKRWSGVIKAALSHRGYVQGGESVVPISAAWEIIDRQIERIEKDLSAESK